jgi:hypothetical protein
MNLRTSLLLPVLASAIITALAQVPNPMPAPGLIVPKTALPYALDHFNNLPQLVPIHHSNVEINNHKGSNTAGALTGGLFFKPKLSVELEGVHARSIVHDVKPVFYLHLLQDPGDTGPEDVYTILRGMPDKDRRIFAQVRFSQMGGDTKREDGMVETITEHLPDGWLRLTPKEPLVPGEYAVSPVMRSQNAFPTMIYDFTLDPAAPNSSEAVQARP